MQQQWVLIINPEYALLKFRPPYIYDNIPKTITYLDGTIYWQVWPGPTSTETRLVPSKDKDGNYMFRDYDCQVYEDQCFYHNSTVRETFVYENPFFEVSGVVEPIDEAELLNDYDSLAETYILYNYLGEDTTDVEIVDMSRQITAELNKFAVNEWSLEKKRLDVESKYEDY